MVSRLRCSGARSLLPVRESVQILGARFGLAVLAGGEFFFGMKMVAGGSTANFLE